MSNAKSELNNFIQKQLKKMIAKEDIVYSMQTFGDQHQATVTLNCMGGLEFAGEVAADAKQAQQNAAAAALAHHAGEVAASSATPAKNNNNKKRKASEAGLSFATPAAAAGNPAITNKSILNAALGRILKKALTKGDIKCDTAKIGDGYQTTLSLPGMPGEWGSLAWAGELGQSQKQAEEHAATHAVAALQADPTYALMVTGGKQPGAKQPGAKKAKTSGGVAAGGIIRPVGFGGGELSGAPAKGNGKAKAKGKARAPREPVGDLPRERISEAPMTGTLDNWRGKFGWIDMSEKVAHPAAKKNKGKVYLSQKDWEQPTPPTKGTAVMFYLYADDAGLGAESCQPTA
mmetsp:Transcript_21834/g.70714  ORF Transcript_21834/g.70714 Transcript_21834/m.70714 type:complete len:346 (+) Transcript_21834:153-1190(+)